MQTYKHLLHLVVPVAILLTTYPKQTSASNNQELEVGLINVMKLDKQTMKRGGDSGKAIQKYMRDGFVNRKPNRRFDYTDYYLIKKPTKFMGHELMLIEEEYMSSYVGCCVSPGVGVTVKVAGNTKDLVLFAESNRCTFSERVDLQELLHSLGIKTAVPRANYVSLSCRARDADQ